MKAMRLFKIKKRIMTAVLSVLILGTSLSGCGLNMKSYEAPDLVSPVAVSRIYRKPEIRDMKDIQCYEGVVVPKSYPVFYDKLTRVENVNVKIGDYVKKGDVIAEGEIVSSVDGEDIDLSIETNASVSVLQNKITDDQIEIEKYNKKEASENKDKDSVKMSETNIELLKEDKRYNEEMSQYESGRNLKQREQYDEELNNSKLIADHSGYVTFLKDISVNDMAMPYENVIVISDMEDLYIEGINSNAAKCDVQNYEEQYTYIDGEKVPITEIPYSQQALSLAEVTNNVLPIRYQVNSKLKAGDNMLLIFKTTVVTDALTVGSGAVTYEGLNTYLYVRKTGDDIEKRSVEVGFNDGRYTEILYGVTEEEEICYPLGEYYPTNYKEAEVKTGEITTVENSFSILGKNSNVKGYYTEFPGKIKDIKVELNQEVSKGDLLFTYMTENTAAKISEIESNINTLRKNHEETIKMLEDMKAKNEIDLVKTQPMEEITNPKSDIPAATKTDAVPDGKNGTYPGQSQKESKYLFEKKDLNDEVFDYRIRMEELSFNLRLHQLQKMYDLMSMNNDGDGLMSVYADRDGIVKNIDLEVTRDKMLKSRTYILSVVDEGYNETLIQMRKKNTNAFGVAVEDKSGPPRAAELGKELHVTIGDDTFGGKAIGSNGNVRSTYLAESDKGFVFTTCTPGTEYRDQFYAELDKEIDYEWAMNNKLKSVQIWFTGKDYKGVPILDKGVIHTEYNENVEMDYVWIQENGELVKRYILTCPIEGYDGSEKIVIDGVEIGDKVIRETVKDTED